MKAFIGEGCPRLEWFDLAQESEVEGVGIEVGEAFMKDSKTRAYTFDAASGSVMHYVWRFLLPVKITSIDPPVLIPGRKRKLSPPFRR